MLFSKHVISAVLHRMMVKKIVSKKSDYTSYSWATSTIHTSCSAKWGANICSRRLSLLQAFWFWILFWNSTQTNLNRRLNVKCSVAIYYSNLMTLFEHYCACENCFCALFVISLFKSDVMSWWSCYHLCYDINATMLMSAYLSPMKSWPLPWYTASGES